MERRSFITNTIAAILWSFLPFNKSFAKMVEIAEKAPKNSMNVLLYLIQSKSGEWKVKATKWTDLNKERLRYSQFKIETFKPLGIYDNTEIQFFQKKYWKHYNCEGILIPVDHAQCSKNGKTTPVVKQSTFKSRSRGGKTNIRNNHIQTLGKEWGAINSKNNIIQHSTQLLGAKKMKEITSAPIQQFDLNGNWIKNWNSINDAKRAGYHGGHISECCNNKKPQYKNCLWKFK